MHRGFKTVRRRTAVVDATYDAHYSIYKANRIRCQKWAEGRRYMDASSGAYIAACDCQQHCWQMLALVYDSCTWMLAVVSTSNGCTLAVTDASSEWMTVGMDVQRE
jgi:hypothetical protein